MYKSKYPSLIEFLTNEEELILLDSEIQNIENLIDKDLKAINYTRCSTQLKDKEANSFENWKKRHIIDTDSFDNYLHDTEGWVEEKQLEKMYEREQSL